MAEQIPERFLRLPEVVELTGLHRDSIYRLAKAEPPRFPRPVKLGERATGFLLSEVQGWIQARVAERNAA